MIRESDQSDVDGWSGAVADAAMSCYAGWDDGLPDVCAKGQTCRLAIDADSRAKIAVTWTNAFLNIITAL